MFCFRRLLHITFIIMLGLLLVAPVLATSGTVTDCSTFDDNNAGDGADTLGELLPGGGTISFTCGGGIQVPEIDITTNTTLDGTGQSVTLSGNYSHRIFWVNTGVHFELVRMSVNGGSYAGQPPEGDGAAVYNNSGTVVITDSTFWDNGYAMQGGAVCNDGGTMTVTNSIFYNNRAVFGGALANIGGTVTIIGSTFRDNNLSEGAGAAIINGDDTNGDSAIMTITNSTFSNNLARGSGGAIQNHTPAAELTVTNTTFFHNRAGSPDGGGGGAIESDGPLTISQSAFTNNSALDGGALQIDGNVVDITNTTFVDNSARFGGGLYNLGGTVTITGSTFTNNESEGAGGAVCNDSSATAVMMTITESNFSGNHAKGSAGAIQNHGTDSTMSISNTTFSGNWADFNAGGIQNEGLLTLSYSTLSNNTAPAGHGGGLENQEGTLLLINSLIANSVGGDCLVSSGAITLEDMNLIEDGSCGALLRGDPKLGPLANNGGATFTHALLPGSLAVDAANGLCPTADQRGTLRPQGFGCDLGAFESPYVSGASAAPRRNLLSTLTPTLNWEQIPFANGYKIQISSSSTFVGTAEYFLTDEVTVDSLSYTLPAAPPLSEGNIYYWRICAIDPDGLCHGWSAAETFVVDVP